MSLPPMIMQSHRLFRVKSGSWYLQDSCNRFRIDKNGNILFRDIDLYGSSQVAIQEYREGNLVDVTEAPSQVVTFEDGTVSDPMPPVDIQSEAAAIVPNKSLGRGRKRKRGNKR